MPRTERTFRETFRCWRQKRRAGRQSSAIGPASLPSIATLAPRIIAEALGTPCPQAPPASRHVSVDLTFRFLPDLYRLAKAASEGDPLCERLRGWAGEWPLSSVGMPDVNPADINDVCEHSGLLLRYVDRIMVRRDRSRLADPRVRAAAQAAIGHFTELAGDLAAALQDSSQPDQGL